MSFEPSINPSSLLTPLDVGIFLGIIALTLGVIALGHYRMPNKGDSTKPGDLVEYLVMGRTLSLPFFTATLVATWYGGIFGVTEIAFEFGVYNFLTQGVFWYLTYILFAAFIVPRLRAYDAMTLPELISRMFGPKAGKVAAVFNFFNVVPVTYALSVGLLTQALFGGALWVNMAIGTALVALYAMFGGLRAVVLSDVVQFGVMCGAVVLVAGISISTFGGYDFLRANLPPSHFDPLGGNSFSTTLVWGFIALSTLVDPNFYQRCFAAESPQTARRGILIATGIWCAFDLCTTLGGMYARALIPDAVPGQAYLTYALQLLPGGLRGFFLAGVTATILSTLDSYIFVASNTLSYDLMPEGLRESVWIRRLGVVTVGVLAVGLGVYFDGSLRDVWKTLGSYSAGCLLAPVLVGYLKPGLMGQRAFIVGSIGGALAMTAWRFTERTGLAQEIDGLYIGVVCTLTLMTLTTLFIEPSPPSEAN